MNAHTACICSILCFGLALRCIASLYPYSGRGKSPMFGDYEAQRHWQEITVNLPINEWYKNSSRNDLMYWGLDYPPLTAYHSWFLGKIAQTYNKQFIELFTSRGFESIEHKLFMRISVILADMLIYLPAIWLFVETNSKILKRRFSFLIYGDVELKHLLIFVMYPGQVLIDNGHFQYNNISLGLTILSIICILREKEGLASFLFCLALNYKQMELYHALPFFIYLLRISLLNERKSYLSRVVSFSKIGLVVILTFFILWFPWIISFDIYSVVHRIFPIARGVFEDKVSNFWCVLNNIIKIKKLFTNEQMVIICFLSTLLTTLPSSIHLFLYPKKKTFIYALFNSSLSFFLFSYQVHEKSILLPTLSALLLIPIDPFVTTWFIQLSTISMFPLFVKDELTLAFAASSLIFYSICKKSLTKRRIIKRSSNLRILSNLSYLLGLILCLFYLYGPLIEGLPHIYSVIISFYSFVHFILFGIYFNYKQIMSQNNDNS